MTLEEIIARIGVERFREEAAIAREDSARPDYGRGDSGRPVDAPHDIEEWIWNSEGSWAERVALFFRVYDAMPCYGQLMYAEHHYREFDVLARNRWWDEVRARLAEENLALRQPIAYSLWCGHFESPETVEEAWTELTGPDVLPEILQVVLPKSGPVPFALKLPVYERLLPFPTFHVAIFKGLVGSAFDYFGKIEIDEARSVLDRLRLRSDQPNLELLREKLGYTKRRPGR